MSVNGGSRSVSPTVTTNYKMIVTGAGGVAYCDTTVTVTTVVIPQTYSPVCTLTAVPTSITKGSAATLTWTTDNASNVSINQGIGGVSLDGSRTVAPTDTTTYTLTATGNGKTVTCNATITVVTTPPPHENPPVCALSVSPSTITRGGSATLTWDTTNATNVSINQGIGGVSLDGTRSVSPTQDTTYTLTATGNGKTVTCDATVHITEIHHTVPVCELSINPSSIKEGDSATLAWGGTNISSVSIDQSVGSVGSSGSRTISPSKGTYTYTGTFKATNGDTLTCSDTLTVTKDTDGGGGGGGSHRRSPRVSLESLPTPDDAPLAFVYLNDMPYTGLDLGPVGTALYWTMLVLWSGAAAYLVLFNVMPFALRRVQNFGQDVKHSLNSEHLIADDVHAHAGAHIAASTAYAPTGPAEVAKSYSSYEGFRSFAQGSHLTIDDIVTGLARESAPAHAPVEPMVVAPEAALPSHSESIAVAAAPAPRAPMASFEVAENVPAFISALLSGNKEAAFESIRQVTRAGEASEEFLTHAIVALDDAYRAKIDGSAVHPAIAALTNNCAPAFLEKVIGALTTAVDGTYSTGVTGVKLAVTRALSVVNG